MVSFLNQEEMNISNEFLKNGYVIKKILDEKASIILKIYLLIS